VIIDCIADLHGYYPTLEGGDLLLVAGDLTARDSENEYLLFGEWILKQNYRCKIITCGNHDSLIEKKHKYSHVCDDLRLPQMFINPFMLSGAEYLCDSGTEFNGLKIWGSPWTLTFEGINPKCKAFTVETEQELADKWASIPDDIDILITHSPPFDILDELIEEGKHAGSTALGHVLMRVRPKLHVFGHIHEAYGQTEYFSGCISVNASHVNEDYQPVNPPIRVIL